MNRVKVAIVGAGVIGLSSAYFLSRKGIDVTVFERRSNVGLETSFGSACLLTPSMSQPWNAPGAFTEILKSLYQKSSPLLLHLSQLPSLLSWGMKFIAQSKESIFLKNATSNINLARYSLGIMADLFSSLNLDIDQGQGTVMIFRRKKSFDLARRHFETFKALHYHVLTPEEILSLEPALNEIDDKLIGGLYFPKDHYGNAYSFCKQLSEICKIMGVKFRFNTPVCSLKKSACSITGIQTPHGTECFDAYVLAAGSHSLTLAKSFNLKLPVRPVKGYSITVPIQDKMPIPQIAVRDYDIHAAITPIGKRLRIAGTAEFAGFNTTLREKRLRNLVALLQTTYPKAIRPFTPINELNPWTGLRPMSADGVPIIGRTHVNNLYLNTGHGPLGWTTAAGSGQLLTDILLRQKTAIDYSPYAYARFN